MYFVFTTIACLIFFLNTPINASTPLQISHKKAIAEVSDHAIFYIDQTQQQTITDLDFKQFKALTKESVQRYYKNETIWIRFQAIIPQERDIPSVLYLKDPTLESVHLYQLKSGTYQELSQTTTSKRLFRKRHTAFELEKFSRSQQTYVLKLVTRHNSNISAFFSSQAYFNDFSVESAAVGTLLYGFILAIALLSGFLYLSMRDFGYLDLTLFSLCFGLNYAVKDGMIETYLALPWKNSWQTLAPLFTVGLIVSLAHMTRNLLKTAENYPRFDLSLIVIQLLAFVLFVPGVLFHTPWLFMLQDSLLVALQIIVTAAIVTSLIQQPHTTSWMMLGARLFFVITTVVHYFRISESEIILHLVFFASALCEVIFLSFAQIGRFSRLQRETTEAQTRALQTQNQLEFSRTLLRTVTHDLANPLSIIKLTAEMSMEEEDDLPEEDIENWTKIYRAAGLQEAIITDVRNLDALRSGKMTLKLRPVNITETFEKSIFLLKENASRKGVSIETVIAPNCVVMADPVAIVNSVVNNLLSNAIKFSYPDSTIALEANNIGDYVQITVRDCGVGMTQKQVHNLFSATKKTSHIGTSGERGTGFGMPLMQAYVRAFGGTITIESKREDEHPDDHGTLFCVQLDTAA